MKNAILLFLVLGLASGAGAQAEQAASIHSDLLAKSDALKKETIDTAFDKDLVATLERLDKEHPSNYFVRASEYLQARDLRKASFLYYIGMLRFRYFNSANPGYKAGGDGALAGSFLSILGEPVDIYLKGSVPNFIRVLRRSLSWYRNHDFHFFPAARNPAQFNRQAASLQEMIDKVAADPATYGKEWQQQIEELRQMIQAQAKEDKQ